MQSVLMPAIIMTEKQSFLAGRIPLTCKAHELYVEYSTPPFYLEQQPLGGRQLLLPAYLSEFHKKGTLQIHYIGM